MAIPQTLILSKNPHCTPQTLVTNNNTHTLTPPSLVRLFSHPTQLKLRLNVRVKSWIDNNNNNSYSNSNSSSGNEYYDRLAGSQLPKPSEIEWKKELCNSVQLIGIVATPVQIKHLTSGKLLAWSRLAVKKSATATTWINMTFWDELAHVAIQHLEKGQQIYVSGRLVSDTVDTDDGKQQTYYKVVVQQLNFVERSFSSVPQYDGDSNSVTPGRRPKNNPVSSTGSTEELWQAFFANPVEWWDNRKDKRSPNYPDFKHKDTGEALWVEGRYNPPWVKSQLSILDSKMEAYQQNTSRGTNFIVGDDFSPF